MGYHRAGFDVVGVDIKPQPRYPFPFHQADALTFPLDGFDAIHASPPCQFATPLRHIQAASYAALHPDLVAGVRERLRAAGVPFVMENVPDAGLLDPVTLCGSMFDLPIRRHRAFETNFPATAPSCAHHRHRELWPEGFPRDISKGRVAKGHATRGTVVTICGQGGGPGKVLDTWRWAMGTPWMRTKREVAESIPPAYTEHIGRQLLAHIGGGM